MTALQMCVYVELSGLAEHPAVVHRLFVPRSVLDRSPIGPASVSGVSVGRQRTVLVLQQLEQEEEPQPVHAGPQRASVLGPGVSSPAGQSDAD